MLVVCVVVDGLVTSKLIVCKKWYKNNLKMRLTALLFDPPRHAPHQVAYKCLDGRDSGDCNWLGSYIDEYIVESIAISSDCISMGINGGFNGGFDGGSFNFTWPCWAIDLSKAFDSSDERLLRLSAKRV